MNMKKRIFDLLVFSFMKRSYKKLNTVNMIKIFAAF